jgi:beta-lactamase class D
MRSLLPSLCSSALVLTLFAGCHQNNVTLDDGLRKHFDRDGVEGSFALYDNALNQFTIYNMTRDTTRFLPASTFKIVNALVALQTGRVTDDSTIIKWDSVVRPRPETNRDLSLYQAFRLSSVPHFQSIARSIGRDTMRAWMDSLHYGNKNLGTQIDMFWLDNSLKISPDEQLGLVKRLYFRQLPFRASVQDIVKRMMIQENNTTYQLAYKTGLGRTDQGENVAWMVGWIEENRHVYPFVLNLGTKDDAVDLVAARPRILKNILAQLGFFQGKM